MLHIWKDQMKTRPPIRPKPGKCVKNRIFRGFGSVFLLILLWGFVNSCVCQDFELGFEFSGLERTKSLVSDNGVFAFGFSEDYWRDGDGFVVGIWYNLGNKTSNVPVWTTGGGLRVSENSTIKLSLEGSLILSDTASGVVDWSSDTDGLGVQSGSLLDDGNLVLLGNGGKVVWESFNSPTNTLLPGQSLHYPHTLRAPSVNSVSSYYSLVIRRTGELALVWENNVTYWGSQLSSTSFAMEALFDPSGMLGLVDANGSTVWSKSSEDFKDPAVVLRHLRIDSDGNLRIYSWDEVSRVWRIGWQAVENQCKVFGSCGLYSFCEYDSGGPVCGCLFEDSVIGDGGSPRSDSGCKKMADLANCDKGAGIKSLNRTVLYGLYPPHDVSIMLNQEACKSYCINDSSCVAATSMNDGSGLCTLKRTGFISGYKDASLSSVSFMKVCNVPQASNPNGNVEKPLQVSRVKNWKNFIVTVVIIVVVSATAFLGIEIFVFWIIHRRRRSKAEGRIPFGKDAQMNPHYSALIRLSFEEVKELTGDFKDQLGPTVFKGVLPNRTPVVAKLLSSVVASERDFRMVVTTLGSTHHRNLVQLKGFCFEPKHKIILYEHTPNGSLEKWLSNPKRDRNGVNWQQRLDIVRGVARALAYLHAECQQCIPHGNLKLENVLLDEKLVPKVTDFGLQTLLVKDSESDSASTSTSSSESLPEKDIYMFGQMMLRILMGQQDIASAGFSPQRLIHEMYHDKKSVGSVEWEGVERACRIALWCMQDRPFLRPAIGEVVKVLEGNLSVDRPPPSAAFKKESQDSEDSTEIVVGS